MSRRRRVLAALPALLLLAACTGGGTSGSGSSSSSAPTTSASGSGPDESSAAGSGSQAGEPAEEAGFAADTSADGGPAAAGATSDPSGQMHVTSLRIGHHDGYDRVVVQLSSAGIPTWSVRYTDATGPGGGPVTVDGVAFLRVGLQTAAEPGVQTSSSVTAESGLIAQAKTTGFFEGAEEALVGVRDTGLPFRAFALTDPGRIVVDVRRP